MNDIISGMMTGSISAIIMNPIDRAIYISTTKGLSIISKNAWENCYRGTMNNVFTKLVTSGLYFAFLDNLSSTYTPFQTALITSFVCNSITNPIQLVKYHSWFQNISLNESCRNIYRKYGICGFGIGFPSIFIRDVCFNYLYITYKKKDDHFNNLLVISGSLVAVSPFNLIKNKKYGNNESLKQIFQNFKFHQLGISMSIARTSVGFYFSQFLYDFIKKNFLK
jgi:hypothetical protein